MKTEKQMLIEDIKDYAIILDDYINKRYEYTINTEYLEEEIKVVSACLLERASFIFSRRFFSFSVKSYFSSN